MFGFPSWKTAEVDFLRCLTPSSRTELLMDSSVGVGVWRVGGARCEVGVDMLVFTVVCLLPPPEPLSVFV